jgi:hypothetical protein
VGGTVAVGCGVGGTGKGDCEVEAGREGGKTEEESFEC